MASKLMILQFIIPRQTGFVEGVYGLMFVPLSLCLSIRAHISETDGDINMKLYEHMLLATCRWVVVHQFLPWI